MARDPHDELRNDAIAAGYSVRLATADDAEAMMHLCLRVWEATYRGLMDDARLDEMLTGATVPGTVEVVEAMNADPRVGLLVGTDRAGRIIGMGNAGPGRDDDAPVHHELRGLDLAEEVWGTGLEHLLMDGLVGTRGAYSWVARGDRRVLRLLMDYGFLHDGATRDHRGAQLVRLVRY